MALRILYILEYYFPHIGGVEILFQNLAEGLAKRGHKIKILTNNLNGFKKFEKVNDVEIYRINFPKPKRFFFTFFSFPFFLKLGKEADIIHSSTYGGVFSASLCAKLLRKPSILSVHEIWMEKWKSVPFVSKIQKLFGSFQEWFLLNLPFDLKVAESKYTLKILNKICNEKNIQIPAGLSVPQNLRWSKKSSEIFKFIYFGRPGHWRGVDILLNAYSKLIKELKNIKLILIMPNDPEKEYKEILNLISKLNLNENIELKKPLERDELFNFLMEIDAVVVPSISEGFGLSAAEASALGVPIISSNAGSLKEVVSGKCLFFESGNILDLKEKMAKAFEGKWEWVEKKDFSQKNFLDSWENVYRSLKK